MSLSQKILSDPVNRWVFSNAQPEAFLVGGYIRDLLLGKISKDRDYVLRKNVPEIAKKAAVQFKGRFIHLKKNQICRVAFRDRQSIDFTYLINTIEKNLFERDFTINALAWSPKTGIVDITAGAADVKSRLIKIINPRNLEHDPLRVIRAYRLSAQLKFSIDEKSVKHLKKYSSGLRDVAAERITEELYNILNCENASYYLWLCNKHNILHKIIDITANNLKINIDKIDRLTRLIRNIESGKYKRTIKNRVLSLLSTSGSQGLTPAGLTKLALLLYQRKDTRKYNHKLKLSNSNYKKLRALQSALSMADDVITSNRLFEIFSMAEDCEYEAALVLSVMKRRNVDKYLNRADDFIKIKNKPLFNGNQIKRILKLPPGKIIGQILRDIQRREFIGMLKKKKDARRWILSNFT